MLFNSLEFLLLFLPLVLCGYRLFLRRATIWLALCSLAFYAWWDMRYLPLLLASICCNFLAGRLLCGAPGAARKPLLGLAVGANLGLLVWYKYAGFLFGLDAAQVLPIGISFFTFTQIAYLVDCARGLVRGQRWGPYVLFVSYFPHLIAGPVLHHGQMMAQFRDGAPLKAEDLAAGLTLFALGLAKKVLLADTLAPLGSPVFAAGAHPTLLEAWIGVLAYSHQLYFDFSGYSDMAVGLARLFGVRLPENFDSPYKARSIADFWRRWHISLSRFLRDYLYIPLGGSRQGRGRHYANLLLTMVLGGAWHGAGWTFLVWGALHGLFLVVQRVWRASAARWWHRPLTLAAVMLAWVPFRAPDMATSGEIWGALFGANGISLPHALHAPLAAISIDLPCTGLRWIDGGAGLPTLALAIALAWWAPNTRQWMARTWDGRLRWAGIAASLYLLCALRLNQPAEFLYFQF